MLSRCVTSLLINLVGKNPRIPWQIERCQFHVTGVARRKKKKKKGEDDFKIIKPETCDDLPKPILEPRCKNALVVGGSDGFGFAAADYLLCKGARCIIIADDNCDQGQLAAKKLCDNYGKGRAHFLRCDVRNRCHFEAGMNEALHKLNTIHILFNNLDKERCSTKCPGKKKEENFAASTIRIALKLLEKNKDGRGGIIINCASIFGFLGWPQDPFPIYCRKEPAIEVTMDFAGENKPEETKVRLVALCPINKLWPEIGLPDLPESIPNKKISELPQCIPTSTHQIGPALCYVLAWAQNGSTWLVEPAVSVYKIPRLIHFRSEGGKKIDPAIYDAQRCPVKFKTDCVDTSKACNAQKIKSCTAKKTSKKK